MVDIRRIEATLSRFGERFLLRVFTETERARAERRAADERVRAGTYAKRFAAKEAAAKALGTGFRQGVFWRDLAVVNLAGGRPTMRLSGGALLRLARLTPPGLVGVIDLSMTDEYPYAHATVVISALAAPAGGGPGVDTGAVAALQAAPAETG